MKKSGFSAEQIIAILTEAAAKAMKVAETCRKHGITEQTLVAGGARTAACMRAKRNACARSRTKIAG